MKVISFLIFFFNMRVRVRAISYGIFYYMFSKSNRFWTFSGHGLSLCKFICEFVYRGAGFEQTIIHIARYCVIDMQTGRTHIVRGGRYIVDFLNLQISKALHSGSQVYNEFQQFPSMFRSGDMHLAVFTYRLTMLHFCLPLD